jgi:hypothetical protein
MKRNKMPKERNPFVQHLIKKKCGAHNKSKKAQRRDDKISLRKNIKDDLNKVVTFFKSSYGPETAVGWQYQTFNLTP